MNPSRETNIVIFGSNFLASQLFVAACGFNDSKITVIDRKDPLIIKGLNYDTFRIIQNHCPDITIKDCYSGRIYGDKTANRQISFVFKDWVHEPIDVYLEDADIIIHAGCIYDKEYSENNPQDTTEVAIKGMNNILYNLKEFALVGDKRPLFMFMSSLNVYGDQSSNTSKDEMLTEDNTIPNPKKLIDLSLYQQENIVRSQLPSFDIDYLILRLGNIIGDYTPPTSLVTGASLAMLNKKKAFTVNDGQNSIELLHTNDLFYLVTAILKKYREVYHDKTNDKEEWTVDKDKETDYKKIVNQIYNVKADEKEEKTVLGVVRAIFRMPDHLPAITAEHKIGRLKNYKVVAPQILKEYDPDAPPTVKFGKPISTEKINLALGFVPMTSLSYALRDTIRYCLNNLCPDISEVHKDALSKIFYIIRSPTVELAKKQGASKSVVDSVKQLTEEMEKSLNAPVVPEQK